MSFTQTESHTPAFYIPNMTIQQTKNGQILEQDAVKMIKEPQHLWSNNGIAYQTKSALA